MGQGIRAPFVPRQARTSATHRWSFSRTVLGSLVLRRPSGRPEDCVVLSCQPIWMARHVSFVGSSVSCRADISVSETLACIPDLKRASSDVFSGIVSSAYRKSIQLFSRSVKKMPIAAAALRPGNRGAFARAPAAAVGDGADGSVLAVA